MKTILPTLFLLICLVAISSGQTYSYENITIDDLLQENDFILSQNPDNITALEYRALILFNEKQYRDAISTSEKIISIDPSSSFAWYTVGNSWASLNNIEKSKEAFQKMAALSPDDPSQYNIQGVAFSRTEMYNDAIRSFKKAIEMYPGYAAAWNNLGVTYLGMNEINQAIDAFNRAISLNPNEPLFYANKGFALLEKRDYDGALSMAKSSRQLDMTSVPGWFVAGEAQFAKKNYNDAFYSFDGGFNSMFKSDLWYYQGSKNTRITKDMDPMDSYYISVASNVRYTGIWERTTIVNYKLKRYQGTLDSFDQIMAITPDYGEGWKKKGYCGIKTDQFESAKDSYTRAMEYNDNDPEILASYGYAIGYLGDYLGAMELIDKAIALDPTYANSYFYKGSMYSFYGQREDAIKALQNALTYDPGNVDAFDELSEVLNKEGDTIGSIYYKIRGMIGF